MYHTYAYPHMPAAWLYYPRVSMGLTPWVEASAMLQQHLLVGLCMVHHCQGTLALRTKGPLGCKHGWGLGYDQLRLEGKGEGWCEQVGGSPVMDCCILNRRRSSSIRVSLSSTASTFWPWLSIRVSTLRIPLSSLFFAWGRVRICLVL